MKLQLTMREEMGIGWRRGTRAFGADVSTFRKNERGTTMVEFAVCAGLFAVLILGIIEFGVASWAKHTVTDAAREGARYAIVRGSESGRETDAAAVASYVQGRTSLSPVQVTTTWPTNTNPGSVVSVRVEYTHQPIGPFIPSKVLSSTSRMVISF